jgi:hypothetical protein
MGRPQRAGGGEEGGVLQHSEHLAALQLTEHFGRVIRAHGLMAMRFSSKASRSMLATAS